MTKVMTTKVAGRRVARPALALLLAGVSVPALAQEAATETAAEAVAAAETVDGTDIVVTAQKRSERLQDVPIAVSALGGDSLERQRVTQADELASKIVNLQLTSTVGDNTPIFALRGVSMSDYSLNQASPVATYYDEVYKGNFAFLGVAMYDLERVEVLRGPQGTLYGKNTTGGAVNLISRTPVLGDTEGYLNLGYLARHWRRASPSPSRAPTAGSRTSSPASPTSRACANMACAAVCSSNRVTARALSCAPRPVTRTPATMAFTPSPRRSTGPGSGVARSRPMSPTAAVRGPGRCR
ncbi:TonB-dependent receptor plug domain-containing protein [Sphingopyxis sp.]|uniref:TonB-dependent receptor plug domain-containing protein n=1 Tax=Sphingopyxis sp. TaxID=1908224 RepID=UPI0025F809E2|nr:TonB-dependent receptor plug domain-containing protein [Sphingopyxis sp.]